jgi:hypothetical protein
MAKERPRMVLPFCGLSESRAKVARAYMMSDLSKAGSAPATKTKMTERARAARLAFLGPPRGFRMRAMAAARIERCCPESERTWAQPAFLKSSDSAWSSSSRQPERRAMRRPELAPPPPADSRAAR